MPKFTVRRIVDAYAMYEAEVEAETAEEASAKACGSEEDYIWSDLPELQTFDARSFVTLDDKGDAMEGTWIGDL